MPGTAETSDFLSDDFFREGDEGTYEGGPNDTLAPTAFDSSESASPCPDESHVERRRKFTRFVAGFLSVLTSILIVPLVQIALERSEPGGELTPAARGSDVAVRAVGPKSTASVSESRNDALAPATPPANVEPRRESKRAKAASARAEPQRGPALPPVATRRVHVESAPRRPRTEAPKAPAAPGRLRSTSRPIYSPPTARFPD